MPWPMPARPRIRTSCSSQPAAFDDEVDDDDHRQRALVALGDAVVDRGPDEQPAAGLRRRARRSRPATSTATSSQRPAQVAAEAGEAGAALRDNDLVPEQARRTRRRASSRSAGRPSSTTRPSSSTTARSASASVDSRWVATITVRPASAGRSRADQLALGVRVDGRQRIVEHDHAGAARSAPGRAPPAGAGRPTG